MNLAARSLSLVLCIALGCASRGTTGKRYNDLPLFQAAVNNDAEGVRRELATGFDVNNTAWGDRTALLYACHSGSTEAAIALLQAGADPTIPDNKGHTPLMWAVRSGKAPLVEALLRTRKSINAQNQTGTTALHYAVTLRRPDLVRMLVAAGADRDLRDTRGRRAADVTHGDPELEAALGLSSSLR